MLYMLRDVYEARLGNLTTESLLRSCDNKTRIEGHDRSSHFLPVPFSGWVLAAQSTPNRLSGVAAFTRFAQRKEAEEKMTRQ
jgi:hypothetical protein